METGYIHTTSNILSLSLSLSLSHTHTHTFPLYFVLVSLFPILQQSLPSPSFDNCILAATTTPALTTPPQTTTTPPAKTTTKPGIVFSFCVVLCCERDVALWEERSLIEQWVVGSIFHDGSIELFLVPARAQRLM